MKLVRVRDGQLVRLPWRAGVAYQLTRCCDCGLEHMIRFKPTKTYLGVKAWRVDDRK